MTDVELLYENMRRVQEAQGYHFNADRGWAINVLEALLKNMGRYGYMSCPCRLASGDRDQDRDIICPCIYRKQDIGDYGSCYCRLYVSPARKSGEVPHQYVPERRPLNYQIQERYL